MTLIEHFDTFGHNKYFAVFTKSCSGLMQCSLFRLKTTMYMGVDYTYDAIGDNERIRRFKNN